MEEDGIIDKYCQERGYSYSFLDKGGEGIVYLV
jgi:hypothetical protein